MNADRLLAHYDRIADAPDAIVRLRRFILDLAVRGKLVPQHPQEEPASELLKRIATEKARLVKAGEIRQEKSPTSADPSGLPFEPRTGWRAATIEQVLIEVQTGPFGSSLHQSDYQVGGIPVVNPASIQNERIIPIDKMAVGATTLDRLSTFKLREGDIVMGRRGEMGRCAVVTDREAGWLCGTGSLILRLPQGIYARFLVLLIGSPYVREYLGDSAVGATMQNLNQAILLNLVIGVPPLSEQRRIVAKVDELMALCHRLEAAHAKREAIRDRLAAASVARLNAPDPDTFHDDARFALDALPALTTRPDQIKQLRQTILNLAVRGKLVPQDPQDEPASELLKRIATEKARLVKAGEKRKPQPVADLTDTNHGLPIPQGWAITNLQSVCTSVTDGDHIPPPKAETGVPFLVIGNVRNQQIDFAGSRFVPPEYYAALDPIRRPKTGDLLYTLVGSYGIPVIVRNDQPFCVQRHIGMLRPSALINVSYLARAMESRLVFDQATACATGIAQKTVPLSGLRRLLIPLPPLVEQHGIAAKVDELMALCDRLEASLLAGDGTRRRLLDALLAEASCPRHSNWRSLDDATEPGPP